MDTRKASSQILNLILSTVRGPAFLGVLSIVLLLATIPANATLLRGYLQESVSAATAEPADSKSTTTATDENQPNRHRSAAAAMTAALSANSFPVSFEGAWKCITIVVESAVPTVAVGDRVESEVAFVPQRDGRIIAHWNQQGWSAAVEDINSLSNIEANMERTNYFAQRNQSAGWAAHSLDHYVQIDPNRIAASSAVDQYVDGRFFGQYKTKSMLFRLTPGNLALGPSPKE